MLENNTQQNQNQRLLYPPYQYFFHHTQITKNKEKILASLQQMGIDIDKLYDKPIGEILKHAEATLRKSYTVKVVAVKDGEIGVLSRRVEMKNRAQKKAEDLGTKSLDGQTLAYVINNYFYPKILKAIKKPIDPKEDEQKQKLLRWQAEQYERLKGKTDNLLPDLDDEQPDQDHKLQCNKLLIAGLGALKTREKNYVLPQVKRFQMGQIKQKEASIESKYETTKNDNKSELFIRSNQEARKLSYSRLLADLTERDIQKPLQKLIIDNTTAQTNISSAKPGGVIYELEEEHDNSPQNNKQKLPLLKKNARSQLTQSDFGTFQKRLLKFQDKFTDV